MVLQIVPYALELVGKMACGLIQRCAEQIIFIIFYLLFLITYVALRSSVLKKELLKSFDLSNILLQGSLQAY